jgi:hypothetical protein
MSMEFRGALQKQLPLQIRIPNPRKPLELLIRPVAEVFLVETTLGPGVVWLDPYWCGETAEASCHIAYASPQSVPGAERWRDEERRYGPKCLVYQKPFLMERLEPESPAWGDYQAWRAWRAERSEWCGREAAWALIQQTFADLILARHL